MKNHTSLFLIYNPLQNILCFIIFLFLFFTSCRTPKQVQYFQGPFDTLALGQISLPDPVIQKGDLVGIKVYSDNSTASASFNQQEYQDPASNGSALPSGIASSISTSNYSMPSYLVDNKGEIHFNSVGTIKVEGLTKQALSDTLQQKLTMYLKAPYCEVRFLNHKFTILGEVTKQGIYSILSDRMNIFEALGVAGDMTLYGLKDSIMIVREDNNKRVFGNINVSDPNVVTSPFYYLKQNDILIVKTNPKKPDISEQTATRNFTRATAVTSILVSITIILIQIFK